MSAASRPAVDTADSGDVGPGDRGNGQGGTCFTTANFDSQTDSQTASIGCHAMDR